MSKKWKIIGILGRGEKEEKEKNMTKIGFL